MLIHDLCLLSILPVHRGYWWMDRGNAEGTYVHKISDTCYYSPVYVDDDDDEIPFQDNRTRRIKCVYSTEYSWEQQSPKCLIWKLSGNVFFRILMWECIVQWMLVRIQIKSFITDEMRVYYNCLWGKQRQLYLKKLQFLCMRLVIVPEIEIELNSCL